MKVIYLIKKHNINDVIDELNGYDRIYVFGEGPTLKNINKESETDMFVCINHAITVIKDCDMMVCSDIEAFDGYDYSMLSNVKYILMPYHIHENGKSHTGLTYKRVISRINDHFRGKLILYNYSGDHVHKKYISLESYMTSANIAVEFLCKFAKVKRYICYGIGIKGKNTYSRMLTNKSHNDDFYSDKELIKIRNDIEDRVKSIGGKVIFN